jgi:hypothetical protein
VTESEQNEKEAAVVKRELLKRLRLDSELVGSGPDYPPREGWDGDHWQVTLHFKGRQMTTLFSKGKGHEGREPGLNEVLYSLQSDANVPLDFEEFCGDFGYDTDSRKAERTHQACIKMSEKLQKLLQASYDDFLNTNWDE